MRAVALFWTDAVERCGAQAGLRESAVLSVPRIGTLF